MDKEQCCQKLLESQKKLYAISKQLDLAAKAEKERDGGAARRCLSHVLSTVSELQALMTWFSQKKGSEDDISTVAQKLKQLENIRKGLEKSVIESRNLWCHLQRKDSATSLQDVQTKEKKCQMNELSDDRNKMGHDVPPAPMSPEIGSAGSISRNFFENSKESCSSREERAKNFDNSENRKRNLYIDITSAKEHIDKLTSGLESETFIEQRPFLSKSTSHLNKDVYDQPDSLGTALSEDEGLGDESRRGDSTGPNSLLEISDSTMDAVVDSPLPCVQESTSLGHELRDPRNSLELCLCTISKLRESLNLKEKELLKVCQKENSEMEELKNVILNQKKNIEDLQSNLNNMKKENGSLKEQVLELEEAENDARLQGQRLQEKLVFLQEKDSHFQIELSETKRALKICVEEISRKDAEEQELRSQLKYMEVLVQKYEDQIRKMESSESALRAELSRLRQEIKTQEQKHSEEYLKQNTKGTQTYNPNIKKPTNHIITENNNNSEFNERNTETHVPFQNDELQTVKEGDKKQNEEQKSEVEDLNRNQDLSSPKTPEITISDYGKNIITHVNNTIHHSSCRLVDCAVQTEDTVENISVCKDNSPLALTSEHTASENSDFLHSALSTSQQDLLERLHHLVEEDADLQQQLHHMDEKNLILWKKLHSLQFHIGECQKTDISEEEIQKAVAEVPDAVSVENTEKENSKKTSVDFVTGEESTGEEIITDLDCNESQLRDRLMQLDKINLSFEKELDLREALFQERERKREEWMRKEDQFMDDLKSLKVERDSLIVQVARLESEKTHLASRVTELEEEVARSRQNNKQETAQIIAERDIVVAQLQERINGLLIREKDYLRQIATLRTEKKKNEDKAEVEKMKTSYVQLQIELESCRNEMERRKSEFDSRLESLSKTYESEESRMMEELNALRQKDEQCKERIKNFQLRHDEMESTLKEKERELEEARTEFKTKILIAEEEHRLVETQLKKKLRQIEEGTAVATKALTEERVRLEKELQENIEDLRSKEELYETRIAELEREVTTLREALGAEEAAGEGHLAVELRGRLEEAERREAAYRETLAAADRLVAAAERGYRHRVEELEHSERVLRERVAKLEAAEARLRGALRGRTPDNMRAELEEAEKREGILRAERDSLEQSLKTALRKAKELDKERKVLEAKLEEREVLEGSLEKERKEREAARKELSRLRASEEGLRAALDEATSVAEARQTRANEDLKRLANEKRALEEALDQLRRHVRELERGATEEEEAKVVRASSLHDEATANLPPSSWCCFHHEISADHETEVVNGSATKNENPGECKCFPNDTEIKSITVAENEQNVPEVIPISTEVLNSTQEEMHKEEDRVNTEIASLKDVSDENIGNQSAGNLEHPRENELLERQPATDTKFEIPSSPIESKKVEDVKPEEETLSSKIFADDLHYPSNEVEDKSPKISHFLEKSKRIKSESSFEEKNSDLDDEDCVARLEECMLRAMDAMKMDLEHTAPTASVESLQEGYISGDILPPFNFRVVQQVGSDTVLVGWEHADVANLVGFEVYVDGHLHETVYVPDRRRAVIGNLDLSKPVILTLRALSVSGRASESCILNLDISRPNFFFQDDSEEEDDLFADEIEGLSEKPQRPYSMDW